MVLAADAHQYGSGRCEISEAVIAQLCCPIGFDERIGGQVSSPPLRQNQPQNNRGQDMSTAQDCCGKAPAPVEVVVKSKIWIGTVQAETGIEQEKRKQPAVEVGDKLWKVHRRCAHCHRPQTHIRGIARLQLSRPARGVAALGVSIDAGSTVGPQAGLWQISGGPHDVEHCASVGLADDIRVQAWSAESRIVGNRHHPSAPHRGGQEPRLILQSDFQLTG
ncbi:Uncharacterised protein [Mycobacteroides abscessus subsp. abscessus]|nr:Uncharacterised protein [Mycobacteroides abscessus subsp. abscessus]